MTQRHPHLPRAAARGTGSDGRSPHGRRRGGSPAGDERDRGGLLREAPLRRRPGNGGGRAGGAAFAWAISASSVAIAELREVEALLGRGAAAGATEDRLVERGRVGVVGTPRPCASGRWRGPPRGGRARRRRAARER